ncbi:hypothetical protein Arub01_00380 [Actinomadura rubrobrunea]|uniref:Histidine kinase/HSP90-like ATPase domain-containing protein n=1 Tax=Actinomadura rubrobrunea TaxID=115335 RepID=A0A9W6PRJ9_9ACTN|nr:ATP-binding protein [Actinomadura rubrobrunea]GLW61794.1 hypothetical protein Arub01_00380 [Actinomadura rubrobrunea]
MSDNPLHLAHGGACAWRLSADAGCAAQARSALGSVMKTLRFPASSIDDGTLAVSELATNALWHATNPYATGTEAPSRLTAPELWTWARIAPQPELVVAVFDAVPELTPQLRAEDVMSPQGRGLGIVQALTSAWGWRRSRSRLASRPICGKAVWFSLPLPSTWPRPPHRIPPTVAAQHLTAHLAHRGITADRCSDATGISVVTTRVLNIWVCHEAFSWTGGDGTHHRHPLIDLQETTEHVLHAIDRSRHPTTRGEGACGVTA